MEYTFTQEQEEILARSLEELIERELETELDYRAEFDRLVQKALETEES